MCRSALRAALRKALREAATHVAPCRGARVAAAEACQCPIVVPSPTARQRYALLCTSGKEPTFSNAEGGVAPSWRRGRGVDYSAQDPLIIGCRVVNVPARVCSGGAVVPSVTVLPRELARTGNREMADGG